MVHMTLALEASPEVLRASLPEPRSFHLAGVGPALIEEELLKAALLHLEQGTSVDLGLMWPREFPGGNGGPVQVDLGLARPLSLAAAAARGQARRALLLALAYDGPLTAFSGVGAVQAPVPDYPGLCRWLGDRQARREFWGEELSPRQVSFQDWLRMTRTLPARLLGLADRGHLGPGARADVALFDLPAGGALAQWPDFVGNCRTLIKGGLVVVEDGQLIRPEVAKATWYRRTGAEPTSLAAELCQYRSLRPENLWVPGDMEGAAWVGI
jgi:formylmethanofuran dehydrogenase subunit A